MENKIKNDEENKELEKIVPVELVDEVLDDVSGGGILVSQFNPAIEDHSEETN